MRPTKVAKNVVVVLMLAAAAVALVKGRRADTRIPPTGPDGRPTVVVDYWEKWTGPEGEQIASVVDDFNKSVGRDKGIYVRIVTTSNIDKKTLVATAAGVPPDIAGMWDPQLVQFAALDALTPLDDLAAAHGITAATYKKVYWDGCHYDGHLYALVSTPATVALIYNKAAFRDSAERLRAAGCDPDRFPRTMDDLDRYAAAVDRKDASGRLTRAGFLPGRVVVLAADAAVVRRRRVGRQGPPVHVDQPAGGGGVHVGAGVQQSGWARARSATSRPAWATSTRRRTRSWPGPRPCRLRARGWPTSS